MTRPCIASCVRVVDVIAELPAAVAGVVQAETEAPKGDEDEDEDGLEPMHFRYRLKFR